VTTMSISASGGNCTGAASTPATFDPLPAAPR
jgi:hypothetical protein